METIDKKLEKVFSNEDKKLSDSEKSLLKEIKEVNIYSEFSSNTSEYKIPLRDTIGKNIYFNTIR